MRITSEAEKEEEDDHMRHTDNIMKMMITPYYDMHKANHHANIAFLHLSLSLPLYSRYCLSCECGGRIKPKHLASYLLSIVCVRMCARLRTVIASSFDLFLPASPMLPTQS